jgi:hypothetical protein
MMKMPMSFDWKTAKEKTTAPGLGESIFGFTFESQTPQGIGVLNYGGEVQHSAELVQSLLNHIENQVKRTTDIAGYAACGKNAYNYVINKFVIPMLIPYYAGQKLDSNGILYIVTQLKQDRDNTKFADTQVLEYDDHIEISPLVIMKAIIDKCM